MPVSRLEQIKGDYPPFAPNRNHMFPGPQWVRSLYEQRLGGAFQYDVVTIMNYSLELLAQVRFLMLIFEFTKPSFRFLSKHKRRVPKGKPTPNPVH
jgi:hypothetical protein